MITTAEYLYFVDRALDGMKDVLAELGDERVNRRPALPGANSPYAIVTHCLGVLDFWAGRLVAGRAVERDRDAEFGATGAALLHVYEELAQHRGQLELTRDVVLGSAL
jgi:hypothetical protein